MAPLLLLGLTEAALTLAGFGHPTSYILSSRQDGTTALVDNPAFGRRFFTPPALARKPLPFALPADQRDDTCRIVLLGESAALGDPSPQFGCARMLERMLRAEYPGVSFEVVNAGMVAINSHVIRHIARDTARLQPDAVLVYMGNNEVVGPYGPGTAFHRFSSSLALIRAGLALRGTKVGQLVERVVGLASRGASDTPRWNGMQMFLEHRIPADDPRLAAAYGHFERNLRDIVAAAESCGARVILSTVAVNLRTSPPFGRTPAADTAFLEAQALDAQGRHPEAGERYALARDLDTLRFRADSRINDAIRRVAGETPGRVTLVDAEQLFAQSAEHGIPGDDLFLEHVHLNFHGNFLLAAALRDALAGQLPASIAARHLPANRLGESECARQLAFTTWDRLTLDEGVHLRLQTPPFTFQADHETRTAARARALASQRAAAGSDVLAEARAGYDEALALAPDDWMLYQGLANLLIASGDMAGAMGAYRRIFQLLPHAIEPYHREAFALAEQGRPEKSVALILANNPDHPRNLAETSRDVAHALLDRGDSARATDLLKDAARLAPDNIEARYDHAMALAQQGRTHEAVAEFKALLVDDPAHVDAHYNLAMALAGQERWSEALTHLERVLALDPDDAEARARADDVRARLGGGPPP